MTEDANLSSTGHPETRHSDKVRVVVNAIHAKSGGGVTHLRNILPHLASDPRIEVHVFLHANQYHQFERVDDRIHLHPFEFSDGFVRTLVWEQLALPAKARAIGADVTFSLANYGPLFAPRPVIMLRNAISVFGREHRFWKRLYWLALAVMTVLSLIRSRHAIAVSEYARRALTFGLRRTGRDKVSVVHHGVDEVYVSPEPRTRKAYLLAVGDIYIQKNFHTLIEALAIAKEAVPNLELKVAGRPIDQGYFQEIAESIRQNGLENSVEFLGSISKEELREHYLDCAVFVFPSTTETFGHPLVEAMASGAPIASSDRTAMPEILGDAGRYFDPSDAHAMADAIVRLLKDPDLARKLGARGRRLAERYSWQRSAARTADILVAVATGAPIPNVS